jgi:hypothetical protein
MYEYGCLNVLVFVSGMQMCFCVCLCACVYYVCLCVCVCVCMCVCVFGLMYVCVYAHACVHKCLYVNMCKLIHFYCVSMFLFNLLACIWFSLCNIVEI